jgi:hypothetical protein
MEILQLGELGDMLLQQAFVLLFRFVDGIDLRRPLVEVDLVALAHPKVLRFDLHFLILPAALGRSSCRTFKRRR